MSHVFKLISLFKRNTFSCEFLYIVENVKKKCFFFISAINIKITFNTENVAEEKQFVIFSKLFNFTHTRYKNFTMKMRPICCISFNFRLIQVKEKKKESAMRPN